MIKETQLPKRLLIPEIRHHMYLRIMPFNLALLTLNAFDNAEAARLMGMKTHKTVERARDGGAVSGEFMGNAMALFRLNADRLIEKGLAISLDTFFVEGTREEREPLAVIAELDEVAA